MGSIYTISPEYLETISNECSMFQYIDIIGYREIDKAIRRFHFTNVKDVLGYLYVSDYMPDFKDMMRLIRKIELTLNKSKILMLVVRDRDSFLNFANQYQGSLVKIRAIAGFEVLTDVILKNAIGTIYKTQAEPYAELEKKRFDDVVVNDKYISFERLVDTEITDLIAPIYLRKYGDLEDTLKYDDLLIDFHRIGDTSSFSYKYRVQYIRACLGYKAEMPEDSPYDYLTTQSLAHILKEGDKNEGKT